MTVTAANCTVCRISGLVDGGVIRLCFFICINVELLDDFERHIGAWKKSGGETSATSVRLHGLGTEVRNVDRLNIGQPLQFVAALWRKQVPAILRW